MSQNSPAQSSSESMTSFEERRNGPTDRRTALEDRRNPERVMDDFSPRRNPELADRRQADH